MINTRQKSILDAVIHEFVETAEPVSSTRLVDKYRFSFSPATVRNDFLALDEEGYLEQPHTSAGRVPTDRGYRFFVDTHTGGVRTGGKPRNDFSALRETRDAEQFLRVVAKQVAVLSDGLVFASFPESELFFSSGLARVFDEPEFNDALLRTHFAELIDELDTIMEKAFARSDFTTPRAFIGNENPIKEARSYSMIVASFKTPYREESIISIIGPKRMNYSRNISLLRELQELLFVRKNCGDEQ
ncbi:MAG: hypothetical protein Q7K44_00070 [Candidatus Liptonbacteria bacterium]|nr:hypothetical protein [Candidatus Liptonbacteria bacterium]